MYNNFYLPSFYLSSFLSSQDITGSMELVRLISVCDIFLKGLPILDLKEIKTFSNKISFKSVLRSQECPNQHSDYSLYWKDGRGCSGGREETPTVVF